MSGWINTESSVIFFSAEVFLQRFPEDRITRICFRKERDRRVKLQIIRIAKNFVHVASFNLNDKFAALLQTASEYRVLQVSASLVEGSDGKAHRHGTGAESTNLRKDEPHPVARFTSAL